MTSALWNNDVATGVNKEEHGEVLGMMQDDNEWEAITGVPLMAEKGDLAYCRNRCLV
jgi:hypothetical protein